MSQHLAQRKLLMIRIVRWTYRRKTSTGFVADIMKIALKHNLWSHIENFLADDTFPTNAQWKRVVLKTIQATEENTWRENLTSKEMDRYLRACTRKVESFLLIPPTSATPIYWSVCDDNSKVVIQLLFS